jgi:hypothetical protein
MSNYEQKAKVANKVSKVCRVVGGLANVPLGAHRIIEEDLPTHLGVQNINFGATIGASATEPNKFTKLKMGLMSAGAGISANTYFQAFKDLATTDANIFGVAERIASPSSYIGMAGTVLKNMLEAKSFASKKLIDALEKISATARTIGSTFMGMAGINQFMLAAESNEMSEVARGVGFISVAMAYFSTFVPADKMPIVKEWLQKLIIGAAATGVGMLGYEAAQGNIAVLEAIGRLAFVINATAISTNQLKNLYEYKSKLAMEGGAHEQEK